MAHFGKVLSLYSSSIRLGICAHPYQGVADLTKEMKKDAMAALTPSRTKIQRFPFIVMRPLMFQLQWLLMSFAASGTVSVTPTFHSVMAGALHGSEGTAGRLPDSVRHE